MITIAKDTLRRALLCAVKFASTDGTRPHLNGVRIETDNGLVYVVATDGYTLLRASLCAKSTTNEWAFLNVTQAKDIADRCKTARNVGHVEVTLTLENGIIDLAVPELPIVSYLCPDAGKRKGVGGKLIDTFPPWREVLPDGNAGDEGKAASLIGLSPEYLARVGAVCKTFSPVNGRREDEGLEISIPKGQLDPIRFDFHDQDRGSIAMIIMPMRIR